MSNMGAGSAYQPRGRTRSRPTSPPTQSHVINFELSLDDSPDRSRSVSHSPIPPQSLRHRRKASRIEDVSEIHLDLESLTPTSAQELRPLPVSPNPPTPPPKPSPPVVRSLQVAPLKIKKKPLTGKPQLSIDTFQMSVPRNVRLLIASVGNPKPYHSTRHSAGHQLLQAFAAKLQIAPLSRSKLGLMASGTAVDMPQYILWQSTSLMNVSGVKLLQAWKAFSHEHDSDAVTGLVVLHDELESAPGSLKLRRGEGSAKGHNGIKSIYDCFRGGGIMAKLGSERFMRVGIGIGRPQSREKGDVSAYVLGQLTAKEKSDIAGQVDELAKILEKEVIRLSALP